MQIGRNWLIKSDSMNVILSQRKKRKNRETGEFHDAWVEIGYFATVANALHELVDRGVRDTELKDLKTIVERIDKLERLIEHALERPEALMEGIKDKV